MRSFFRAVAGTVAFAAVSAFCVGCTVDPDQGGSPWFQSEGRIPVAIGVESDSPEQVVLGEIYSRIFDQMGYAVGITSLAEGAARDGVETLRTEPVDLVVSCTGALLEAEDPAAAAALAQSGATGRSSPASPTTPRRA
ncbi:hypothetical protein JKI95_02210 [Corynebacterium aquatimens]|uniref:hypothetical protein n=1 Tax=Corynebacterium aquatimens TaxID=1190508 RepID=UPI00253F81B1|nr:hypothetical protein [Corynebacterium aquatimens]QYH19923.1 hypothetical protein JKI95_02210 [Corynebacterium aquatimens]